MNYIKLKYKPLSVNDCWKGQRFKTDKYKKYERDLLFMLPNLVVQNGKLKLDIQLGVSSKSADIDNPIKPLLDILQKKYGFNDKDIYELRITKEDVLKGNEFICIYIK
jgi:Holliday junction resolvase RusA-like endonuclease